MTTPAWEKHKAGGTGDGWKLFVNDIEKVESPLLKSLLQSWTVSEEEVDVDKVDLTGK